MKKATRDQVREGVIRSAREIVPMILNETPVMSGMDEAAGWGKWPTNLLDVGAGEGHWLREFRLHRPAMFLHGVDVEPREERLGWPFVSKWDAEAGDRLPMMSGPGVMTGPDDWDGEHKWSLALCMEVAEHVDADAGAWLVGELCRVAHFVVFGAAIPGQGGDGHKNEQWPHYWHDLFQEQGYILTDCYRHRLWDDPAVEPWYRQNTLIACPGSPGTRAPLNLIHPEIYGWRIGERDYWREAYLAKDAECTSLIEAAAGGSL